MNHRTGPLCQMPGSVDMAKSLQTWMTSKSRQIAGAELVSYMMGSEDWKSVSDFPLDGLSKLLRHTKPADLPNGSTETVEQFLRNSTTLLHNEAWMVVKSSKLSQ